MRAVCTIIIIQFLFSLSLQLLMFFLYINIMTTNFQKAVKNIRSNTDNLKKITKNKLDLALKNYDDCIASKENLISEQTHEMENLAIDLLKDYAVIEANIIMIENASKSIKSPNNTKKSDSKKK